MKKTNNLRFKIKDGSVEFILSEAEELTIGLGLKKSQTFLNRFNFLPSAAAYCRCLLPTAYCLLLTAYCLLLPTISFSQDIHFSQYDFSPLTLNPALTSAYKNNQVTVHYKEQWKVANAYRTSAVTFEMKLNQKIWKKLAKGLAFGINVFSDKAGDGNMKQTQANLSIAYHTLLDQNNTLSGGIMGGVAQRSISPNGLRWNNQYLGGVYDPNISSGENFSTQSFVNGDYSAGLLWSYGEGSRYMTANDQKFINAGFAVSHVGNPKQSFIGNSSEQLNWKWTVHANSLLGIENTPFSIGPSLLYMRQGAFNELTFGGLIKYKFKEASKYTGYIKGAAISAGCFYRNRDAVMPFFLIEIDRYSIGISYDTNISGLANATNGRGGFEITLRFGNPSSFNKFNAKSRF